MTKRHFIRLAEEIANIEDRELAWQVAKIFARMCREFNPRFNREKFMAACGLEEE